MSTRNRNQTRFEEPQVVISYGFAGYGPNSRYPTGGTALQDNVDHIRLVPVKPDRVLATEYEISIPMRAIPDLIDALRARYAAWWINQDSPGVTEIPRTRVRRKPVGKGVDAGARGSWSRDDDDGGSESNGHVAGGGSGRKPAGRRPRLVV